MIIQTTFPYPECEQCPDCILDVKKEYTDNCTILKVGCKKQGKCERMVYEDGKTSNSV